MTGGPGQCSFAHTNLAPFPVTLAGDAVGVGELGSPVGAVGATRRPDETRRVGARGLGSWSLRPSAWRPGVLPAPAELGEPPHTRLHLA